MSKTGSVVFSPDSLEFTLNLSPIPGPPGIRETRFSLKDQNISVFCDEGFLFTLANFELEKSSAWFKLNKLTLVVTKLP